ncbi:MAG: hypothetical protein A2V88_07500 [Elusimicrobia bacterium RBG_16_66_12]|nr:MAG: hypothetical protein A2V88_07500 [Elusimicrobia bacterium RBG_16_66_12]
MGDPCDPDDDNDLNDDADELACGSDPLLATKQPERLGNGLDDDGDGSTDETQPTVPGADCDGDGYDDNVEAALTWPPQNGATAETQAAGQCDDIADDDADTIVNDGCPQPGTGRQSRCSDSGVGNDETDDSWSADFNDDTKLNLVDVNSFNVPFKHFSQTPLANHRRWNIAGGSTINLADVNNLGTLKPAMLNGERAFGNPMWGGAGACHVN